MSSLNCPTEVGLEAFFLHESKKPHPAASERNLEAAKIGKTQSGRELTAGMTLALHVDDREVTSYRLVIFFSSFKPDDEIVLQPSEEVADMKADQPMTNNERNDRKSQGVASATSAGPTPKESGNRKGEEKKKIKPDRLAQSAGQGK